MPEPRFELETLACYIKVIWYPHKYNALPLSYTGTVDEAQVCMECRERESGGLQRMET